MLVAIVIGIAVVMGPPRLPGQLRSSTANSVPILEAVAAELRRGASLRMALASALPGTRLARLARSGQPMNVVGQELRLWFGADRTVATAVELAATTGAPSAELFDLLAERVRDRQRLALRRRVLTAQARMSALVVGLLPIVIGIFLLATRSTGIIAESAAARTAVLVGLALQLAGAMVVGLLLRRARL